MVVRATGQRFESFTQDGQHPLRSQPAVFRLLLRILAPRHEPVAPRAQDVEVLALGEDLRDARVQNRRSVHLDIARTKGWQWCGNEEVGRPQALLEALAEQSELLHRPPPGKGAFARHVPQLGALM